MNGEGLFVQNSHRRRIYNQLITWCTKRIDAMHKERRENEWDMTANIISVFENFGVRRVKGEFRFMGSLNASLQSVDG